MNDTYFLLLEFLEPWGIDRDVQIEAQLYEWFNQQISVDPLEPFDSVNARIERFCYTMQINQHAKFEITKLRSEGSQERLQVGGRLMFLGLQYLNEHRLTQSNLRLNETLETNTRQQAVFDQTIAENSRSQTTIFRWTAGFACIAMIAAVVSVWRDFHKDTLQQQLSQRDSLINKIQKSQYRLKTDSSRLTGEVKTLTKKLSNDSSHNPF